MERMPFTPKFHMNLPRHRRSVVRRMRRASCGNIAKAREHTFCADASLVCIGGFRLVEATRRGSFRSAMPRSIAQLLLLILLGWLSAPRQAAAHQTDSSYLRARLQPGLLEVRATFDAYTLQKIAP